MYLFLLWSVYVLWGLPGLYRKEDEPLVAGKLLADGVWDELVGQVEVEGAVWWEALLDPGSMVGHDGSQVWCKVLDPVINPGGAYGRVILEGLAHVADDARNKALEVCFGDRKADSLVPGDLRGGVTGGTHPLAEKLLDHRLCPFHWVSLDVDKDCFWVDLG